MNLLLIQTWMDFVQVIRSSPGHLLELEILRNNQITSLTITPETATENGKQIGKIGIAPVVNQAEFDELLVTVSYPPAKAIHKAIEKHPMTKYSDEFVYLKFHM